MSIRERLTQQAGKIQPSNNKNALPPPKRPGQDMAKFQAIKEKLHLSLIEKINTISDWQNISDSDQNSFIKQFIEKRLEQEFGSTPLSISEKDMIVQEIRQELKGFGPLDPLLTDPAISDILVNGPYQVYVEISGKLKKTNVVFKDNTHLLNII